MTALASVWPLSLGILGPHLPRVRLDGPRIYLQPPCMKDWRDWCEVRARNEAYLKPFEPLWPENCLNKNFFRRRLCRQQCDWEQQLARYFLIRRNDTGALIGGININNLQFGAARHGSLGYWIDEAHQGHGYMGEAISLVLSYAFMGLGLMRVHAACVPENDKSKRLILRSGLKEEGFAPAYLQINGAWRDHHLFAITRADYLSATGAGR